MKCYDGVTRAVPLVNGVKIDPSLSKKSELSEKKNGEKKTKPKNINRLFVGGGRYGKSTIFDQVG